MDKKLIFIKICYWIGIVADAVSCIPLLFPELGKVMFGLQSLTAGEEYLYVSRMAATLMLGWTFLLFWGVLKPVERRGVLLLTVLPVMVGMIASTILVVTSGLVMIFNILPMVIWQVLLTGLFLSAYFLAAKIKKTG